MDHAIIIHKRIIIYEIYSYVHTQIAKRAHDAHDALSKL